MMIIAHIAATAASTPVSENDALTAVGLALLISLGLATAALGAMVLNRSLTRAWVRFHRSRRSEEVDPTWTPEESAKVLMD